MYIPQVPGSLFSTGRAQFSICAGLSGLVGELPGLCDLYKNALLLLFLVGENWSKCCSQVLKFTSLQCYKSSAVVEIRLYRLVIFMCITCLHLQVVVFSNKVSISFRKLKYIYTLCVSARVCEMQI